MKKDDMELLNAHGPYEHGLWNELSKDQVDIKSDTAEEGGFHNRSRHLASKIAKILTESYSAEELSKMTIADVGCYDAWILVSLSQVIKFKTAVGVEPRLKNIQKGIEARRIYNVTTNVQVIQSDIDNLQNVLKDQTFDIVLCLGLLHHVDSTPRAIQNLGKLTNNLLIVDTMVIKKPKAKEEKKILELLKLKDISYLNSAKDWAIAAFKYETPYFDGSAFQNSIVNVPEERLVRMSLKIENFETIMIDRPDEVAYSKEFKKVFRFKEILLVAKKHDYSFVEHPLNDWENNAKEYEEIYCFTLLNQNLLKNWAAYFDIKLDEFAPIDQEARLSVKDLLVLQIGKNPFGKKAQIIQKFLKLDPSLSQVIVNISRSPYAKLSLEISKNLIIVGDYHQAKGMLINICIRANTDWRAFYRACYLLVLIGKQTNDEELVDHYSNLLKIANSEFPLSVENGLEWMKSSLNTSKMK
jgi:2-polyprenyl-3-methyl-5-hydroxy-6-metoxy-1,4-benzoquinol methylase